MASLRRKDLSEKQAFGALSEDTETAIPWERRAPGSGASTHTLETEMSLLSLRNRMEANAKMKNTVWDNVGETDKRSIMQGLEYHSKAFEFYFTPHSV